MRSVMVVIALLLVIGMLGMLPEAKAQSSGGSNIMELDAIVVEGRIQRPQASYIIQRAGLDFGIQAKRKSFVGKIVESIKDNPF